jgi:hypothetical protein
MATAFISPAGAVIMKGDGIKSVQARMQESFEQARKLGPTMKAIQQVAADFVREVEGQHLAEGLEIIEEKKSAIPLKPLVDRAAPILERLARTPIIRKRPDRNVWNIEEIPTDAPEKLFEAALVSLGHKPADSVYESRTHISILPMTAVPDKRRSWWRR